MSIDLISVEQICPSYWKEFNLQTYSGEFVHSIIRTSDDCPISVYEAGMHNPNALVLLNAPGTPFLVLAKLATLLAEEFHVIAWDNRGSCFLDGDFDCNDLSLPRQARDFGEVLEEKKIDECSLCCYCGAGNLAAHILEAQRIRIIRMALIAPAFDFGEEKMMLAKSFFPLFEELGKAQTEHEALATYEHIVSLTRLTSSGLTGEVRELKDLLDVTHRSFRNAVKYSKEVAANRFDRQHLISNLGAVKQIVVHCMQDQVANYRNSEIYASLVKDCRLKISETGDHFFPYYADRTERLARDIDTFMRGA